MCTPSLSLDVSMILNKSLTGTQRTFGFDFLFVLVNVLSTNGIPFSYGLEGFRLLNVLMSTCHTIIRY